MSPVWPILNRNIIIRDVRFEEDHEVGFFLIERSLVRGCVCQVLCHEEVMKERYNNTVQQFFFGPD